MPNYLLIKKNYKTVAAHQQFNDAQAKPKTLEQRKGD